MIKRRPIATVVGDTKDIHIYHPRSTTERVKMQDRIHAANRHGYITNAQAENLLAILEGTRGKTQGRRVRRRRARRG